MSLTGKHPSENDTSFLTSVTNNLDEQTFHSDFPNVVSKVSQKQWIRFCTLGATIVATSASLIHGYAAPLLIPLPAGDLGKAV